MRGHLFVGTGVRDSREAANVLLALGAPPDEVYEALASGLLAEVQPPTRSVRIGGRNIHVSPALVASFEGGKGSLVGFALTGQPEPIIDRDGRDGSLPFPVNVAACSDILAQVRGWWPDAELLLADILS